MNIKFKKIEIQNFLSIGDASLIFSNNGYTLVKGINNNKDDLAISNGSGKSSLFEAICWCLTGETIRGIKSDISNINTDDGAYVELDLEVSGDTWKIIRTKDHKLYKTNLKLFRNDQDISGKGIRDSSKILNEYLPDLTSSLIGSVIILGQGLPQRFSNNTPSGRKDVLEKLSKSDFMIEDLKDRVAKRKIYLSKELRKYEDLLLENESKLSILESSVLQKENSLKSLKDKKSIEKEIENLTNSLELFNKQLDKLKEDRESKCNIIQDLRIKYSSLTKKAVARGSSSIGRRKYSLSSDVRTLISSLTSI
jgi:DNA repair exonuclease SbcCD ATPase subunit